ncbi:hypothetical protein [Dorea sp. D27]|uniref:hypothetical protein n=1 Tax=Dorea sp. D27 TaxID=658665 RepID=UPI0006739095|nr:hypothetical protein [Dorea sp. D27]KMZ52706.1 hypothetical protein HMPREF0980_03149 [Dorea sp. D27]
MKGKRFIFMALAVMMLAMCCREDVRASKEQGGETTVSINFLPPDTDTGQEEKGTAQEDKAAPPTGDSLLPAAIWAAIFFLAGLFLITTCLKMRFAALKTGPQRFTEDNAEKRGWGEE